MTTPKRKSVPLNKGLKGEILHSFFMDISRQARIELKKVEEAVAMEIYDIIYGDMDFDLQAVDNRMLCLYKSIPMTSVNVKKKKKARKKGEIEPTQSESLRWCNFSDNLSLGFPSVTVRRDHITLPKLLPQYNEHEVRRWEDHIKVLVLKKLIKQADQKNIEALYVKAVRDARLIYGPIVAIMEGVIEIMANVKTTTGLFKAWPECEKFLNLPEESSGVLMKVDVPQLNKALAGYYPPAEKTGGA